MATKERPEIVEEEHLLFLDELRDSGATNMFGAPAYVEQEFDVSSTDAKAITLYWMETFGDENR